MPNLQEINALFRLRYAAMNKCLIDNGSSARFVLPAGASEFLSLLFEQPRTYSSDYGFFDTTNAASYGYRRPPGSTGGLVEEAPAGATRDLVTTCRDAGSSAMLGLRSVTQLSSTAILPDGGPPSAVADSRFVQGVAAWRNCMAAAGYANVDPVSLAFDRRWQTDDGTRAGIITASADIACKLSTNLVGIYLAVQSAYDQRYIDSHITQLVAFRDSYETAIRNAGSDAQG